MDKEFNDTPIVLTLLALAAVIQWIAFYYLT